MSINVNSLFFLPLDTHIDLGEVVMLQFSCKATPDIAPFKDKALLTIIVACGQEEMGNNLTTVNDDRLSLQHSFIFYPHGHLF